MILAAQDRIAEFKRRGWWGDRTLDDLLLANVAAAPEAEALVDPPNLDRLTGVAPRRLTWREVEAGVRARAALLHAHGLGSDDVLLLQLPNGVEQTLFYLACFRLGVIVSPAPTQYRVHELAGIAARVDASAAVTSARIGRHDHHALLAQVQARTPTLKQVFVMGEAPDGEKSLEAALSALPSQEAPPTARAGPDDIATVCWTSGTEAEPKGVPRSHNEWIIMGEAIIAAAQLAQGVRLLNPFPMVNMAGLSTGLVTWLLTGGVLVQHHPFELDVFLAQIRDERIAYTVAPPAVLTALLKDEQLAAGIDFSRLNRIGSGSAPLSEWMVRTFQERHGVEVINYFGSNEGASFAGCIEDIPDPATRASCFPRLGVGGFSWRYRLADRLFTRLVDPDTGAEILAPGRPGELRVKGPTIFSGYWRAPELTARAFDTEGWFRTGDLFEIAGEDGRYYRFVGRHKDIVIRGGVNISAEEIERHLMEHPAVAEAAVIGAPDREMGERLCACITPRGTAPTLAELNRFLVEEKQLAPFKQIERLEVLDALPRNPVGKVLKRDLRRLLFETEVS